MRGRNQVRVKLSHCGENRGPRWRSVDRDHSFIVCAEIMQIAFVYWSDTNSKRTLFKSIDYDCISSVVTRGVKSHGMVGYVISNDNMGNMHIMLARTLLQSLTAFSMRRRCSLTSRQVHRRCDCGANMPRIHSIRDSATDGP